jgi:hypothetical protein
MRHMGGILTGVVLALAGCAATGVPGGPAVGQSEGQGEGDGMCRAEAAQSMIGQQASAELGQRLLALTGARQLRWAPPDSALTMDFRPDRLTVSYDRDRRVDRITCG